MNKTHKQLTRELIAVRKTQHISQRELAKRAGTTQAVISRIENLDVNPSIGLLNRISVALGQSINISTSPTIEKIKHKLVGEYQTLNLISINSKSLKHNFEFFKKENPQAQISPVLKSNAYGHGLIQVGEWVDKNLKVPFISVDSLYEAYKLKNIGVETPILVMGYTDPKNFQVFTDLSNLHVAVFDLETLNSIAKYQPRIKVHIKIDTGMNRLGLLPDQISYFIQHLKSQNTLNISGIFSHLSQADTNTSYTQQQVKVFKQAIHLFELAGFNFKYKHIAATAGSCTVKDPEFNTIRLGLGLYGYSPFSTSSDLAHQGLTLNKHLEPALTLTSKLAQIKTVGEGSAVSYGGTFITKKSTTLAILPIGYYDGLSRNLSNKGYVYVQEKPCPIIGNISMNQTIIDINRVKNAKVGDTVEIISPNNKQKNSIYALENYQNTIPYTILTSLSETTRRVML
jgi:alanine racemase